MSERPLPAYDGDEPYIFVSYAHADDDLVYPEIEWLHDQGFNVWYDEGISPGSSWRGELAEKIDGASLFVFLITPRSVVSDHCEREVNYAVDHGKTVVAVHLAETEMPSGLDLTLGTIQAILKHELSEHDYRKKLIGAASTHIQRGIAPTRVRPSAIGSTRSWWRYASVGLLVVASLTAGWLLKPTPTPTDRIAGQPVQQTEAAVPVLRVPVELEGWIKHKTANPPLNPTPSIAISPSGDAIAFTRRGDGGTALAVRHLDRLSTEILAGTEGAEKPFFSPDGRWIGYFDNNVMKRVSVDGGTPSIITTLERASNGASWGADDRIVFAEGWIGLKSVSVGGGEHQEVTTLDISPSRGAHRVPHHVAGSPVLLFAIAATTRHEIWAVNLETGDARYLLDGISPSYVASGHMVYAQAETQRGGSLWAVRFDARTLTLAGPSELVQSGVAGREGTTFAVSHSGALVYLPSQGERRGELVLLQPDGSSKVLARGTNFRHPTFSNDGRSVAAAVTEEGKPQAIWIYEIQSGASWKVTENGMFTAPLWSPDDQSITSTKFGTGLIRQNLNDRQSPETLVDYAQMVQAHAWLGDGTTLLYIEALSGVNDVFLRNSDGVIRNIYHGLLSYPSVTDDGRWVAFCRWPRGAVVARFPGITSVHVASDSGCFPRWGPGNSRLYYQDSQQLWAVETTIAESVAFGSRELIADLGYPGFNLFDVDDAGRVIIARHTDTEPKPAVLMMNWIESLY